MYVKLMYNYVEVEKFGKILRSEGEGDGAFQEGRKESLDRPYHGNSGNW